MILDNTLILSDAQAITASAASTNIFDLGATGTPFGGVAMVRDNGKGTDLPLLVMVVEAFNNLTSLTCAVQTDDNSGFASPRIVLSQTLTLAELAQGKNFSFGAVPLSSSERYWRLFYTVTGTAPTTGKITAGIIAGLQTNGVTF